MTLTNHPELSSRGARRWIAYGLWGWLAMALLWPATRFVWHWLMGIPIDVGDILVHSAILHIIGLLLMPGVLLVAQRFPLSGTSRIRNLLIHTVGVALFVASWSALLTISTLALGISALPEGRTPTWEFMRAVVGTSYYTVLIYALLVAAHHAFLSLQQARQREVQTARLEAKLSQVELEVLRIQLQPHFLFNTLHGISALMDKDTGKARSMIALLSEMLRRSLDNSQAQEGVLEEELAFLDRYVELQRMRFGDRLTVEYHIDPAVREALVPRLILQPLVENSLRHGFARRVAAGHVDIVAEAHGERLQLVVSDNGAGLPHGQDAPEREGVGLRNTRARLRQLYGDAQALEFERSASGGLKVLVSMPLQLPPAPLLHLVPENTNAATA